MKTINKLLLPDATYDLIIERAEAEGVEPAYYCSCLLTECLNIGTRKVPPLDFGARRQSAAEASGIGSTLSDTLEQIIAVFRLVHINKMEFAEAVRRVATDLNIEETTVRDKCTRRISLPNAPIGTAQFLDLLARPNALKDYLCRRYPKFSSEIAQHFESIIPEASK